MNNLIASNHVLRLDVICELPDDLLLDRVRELAARERLSTAELVAHLAEVDLRRLYLGCGCSSMFTYCTELLHLSESAAYSRIEVARTARRFPQLLPLLADGSLSLTTVRRLGPVLTYENYERLVLAARHRTARQVDELIARERPKPDAPAKMRRLPRRHPRRIEHVSGRVQDETSTPGDSGLFASASSSPALDRASIQPLAPERHRVQFTASGEMRERIERLQELLRPRIPDGDLAEVIDTALIELITKLEARKCGTLSARRAKQRAGAPAAPAAPAASATPETTAAPSLPKRSIPQAVRRAVRERDAGRCAFFSDDGRRCSATGFLEFHHLEPFARGGETTTANLELRCRSHNAFEAQNVGLGRRGG